MGESMKKIVKAVLSSLIIMGLVLGGFVLAANLTERKNSIEKFAQFYEQEEDFDVLFLGQSHVLNGIFPMELWNDYGIVSYNMAGHGNRLAMSYWVLKSALEYTKPKLVVLDCGMLGVDEKVGAIEQLHLSVDHIPFGQTKINMIKDLIEDEDRQMEFLWKFSTYHHRWNELEEKDFNLQATPEKGAESRINVAVPANLLTVDASEKGNDEGMGIEYAKKIIEECQKKDMDVLLTYLPFPDETGWQVESNRAWDLAEEYGLNYLDFNTLLEQVNLHTDYYDKDSHMNPSGARKVTSFIGNYIIQNYPIEDHREDEAYSGWHEDYEVYTQFKIANIKKEDELKNYLMLLNDKNFSFGIYFKPWSQIATYPVLIELLNNMGITYSEIPNEDYFLVVDRINDKQEEMRLFETLETEFGEFSMFYNDEGHLEFTNSKAENMIITQSDIAIVVFNNSDLAFVDQANFVLKDMPVEFYENQ